MIKANIDRIRDNIARSCQKVERDPTEVTVVCVTKEANISQIKEVISYGIRDIAENRVQDAEYKYREICEFLKSEKKDFHLRWHMIGHLQRNKVKKALGMFELIHSVDSVPLAQEIDRQAHILRKTAGILIEVNTSGELTKFGLKPSAVIEVMREVSKFKNINIRGLMTIAPFVADSEKARPYFKILKNLRDELNKLQITNSKLEILSMGMSNDFEIAIEEGANMVRIGRGIFKKPDYYN